MLPAISPHYSFNFAYYNIKTHLQLKKVAVLTGGYSDEIDVSYRSANTVFENLKKGKYEPILVKILKEGWYAQHNNQWLEIDRNDFSFTTEKGKVKFDFVFVVIHGTPGEDGKLQGYFEMLDIPYSTGNVLNTALTFNKISTKQALDEKGYFTAPYVHYRPQDDIDIDEVIAKLGLPLFVKPAESGSSIGISKVKKKEGLRAAIDYAFKYHDQVLIEGFVAGREITCGCFVNDGVVTALSITEVITQKEFFDYKAKYEHDQTVEVTPANLTSGETELVKDTTRKIYQVLGCRGIVRVDYILSENGLMVIEINTVPGMTDMSFIPQQAKADGLGLTELFEANILL